MLAFLLLSGRSRASSSVYPVWSSGSDTQGNSGDALVRGQAGWAAGAGSCWAGGHGGSRPRHFRAGFGSAARNIKWEHVASFKLMAVKIHPSCIFLFLGKNNQFSHLCPFSAGSAFVIVRDLDSKDSERKMSFILPVQNNTNYTSTPWHFH